MLFPGRTHPSTESNRNNQATRTLLSSSQSPARTPAPTQRKSPIASAWLTALFFVATRAPWVLKILRPIVVPLTVACSTTIAPGLRCNANRIFARKLSPREHRAFAQKVVGNFYDVIADLALSRHQSADQILQRVEKVEGEPEYLEARKTGLGAILVTAHMGAFEVGLASLRRVEANVHVVFKRDEFPTFERIRSRVRTLLGVHEAPIDEGLPALMRLRDALRANEVVVIQGDRAMPGQRAASLPFFTGHLPMPVGPVTLAQITGSPIIPVFVIRAPGAKFRIHLGTPIYVEPDHHSVDGINPALAMIAKAMQGQIAANPDQWLVLDRAFEEDSIRAS